MIEETLEQARELARQLTRVEQKLEGVSINTSPWYTPTGSPPGVGLASGVTSLFWPPKSSSEDQKLLDTIRKSLKAEIAVVAAPKPRCPKCGATEENFKLGDAKGFNRRSKHHDVTCGKCNAVVRQFHYLDADEQKREWSCPAVCKFHLNPEGPTPPP